MKTRALQCDRGNALILATACFAMALWSISCGGGGSTAAVPVSTVGFSVSSTTVTFGNQAVGTTSAAQSATLTNSGNATLSISSIQVTGPNGGDFASTNTCGSSLAPSAQCTLSVTFTPTSTGTRTASVVFTDNAAGSPQTVSLTGTGAASGVELSATTLTFGSQLLGTPTPAQSVTLTNSGDLALNITSIAVTGANPGDFPETTTCGSAVAAGADCTMSVTFAPTATGSRTATITITDSATGSPQTLTLTGTGSNPVVSLTPNSIAFGNQNIGATSPAQSVTLNNTGNASLTIASIAVAGANSGDFTETNNCGASVAAAGSCTISVTFTPSAAGSRAASVAITDNAGGSPQIITLTGTGGGTAPAAGLSTNSLTFGSQSLGTSSSALSATLSNTGNATLTTAIAVTGANAGDFGETDNCGGSVAAGASCTISVTFKPTLQPPSTENAALTITDNAADSPQIVSLSGTGTSSQVSLSATTLNLGSRAVGTTSTPPQAVTLTNTGNASLAITNIGTTGTNPGDFAVTHTCGTSVAAGGSCTISVTFTPAALSTRTAVVSITDSATGSPQTVNLTGTGSAPAASLTATSLDFGTQTLGTTSAVQPVTLTNQGNAALSVTSLAVTGTDAGDFGQTNTCGSSVPAGGNCIISVTFTPTLASAENAAMTITDNAASSPQTVSLSGTGSGPIVDLDPTLSFGSLAVGSTSKSQALNLRNSGNAALTITSAAFSGANPGEFAVTGTCGSSVPAGSTCKFNLAFAPKTPGTHTATFSIKDNATSSPQTAYLTGTGSAPLASVTPASLTFSLQNLSTTSAAQAITLRNTGTTALAISSIAFIGANPGDFGQTTTCGTSLAAGKACTISVTFTPTGSESRTASLTITDNSNNVAGSLQSVSLTGTGTGPIVTLSPSILSFGSQTVNATTTAQIITLTNTGSGNLTPLSITVTGTHAPDFAQTNNCGNIVVVNASCAINVTFTPSASGGRTAAISLTDNAPGSPQSVALAGTGLSGSVSLTPSSLTFASQNVGTTSIAQSVMMTNTGNMVIAIGSISLVGANAGDFSETNGCGSSLAVNTSCTIVVKFTPSGFGTRTATVSIVDNLQSSPEAVALTGTGSGAAVSLSTSALNFATQNLGQPSAAQTVTLSNTGNATLTITGFSTAGTDPGDFAQTNTCGSPVAANGSCTIGVTFTPAGNGSRTASLMIADNAGGSPQTVSLAGNGVGPIAGVTPTSMTFNSQTVATTSAAQTLTLSNTGNAALDISSIAFMGANPGDFVETTTCGNSLAASSSCTFSVTFTPTASGSRTASLTITDNTNNVAGGQQSVSLTGTGSSPIVSLSASTLSFSSQTQNTTSTAQSVTLANTGNASLTLTGISVTGTNAGDFAQTNTCGSSVAAGGNCTISVTFTPTALGTRTASIAITDNAPGSPQPLTLAGTGIASQASLSPPSLTFGSQSVGVASASQTVTLTNTGTAALTINSMGLAGANPGDFGQTNTCGSSVAANGSCTISVTFTPAAVGSRTASLSIADTAPGSPQTVSLAGTGTAPVVSLSASSLGFGTQNVGTTSAPPPTLTLNNTGNATLTISTLMVTGTNSGDFAQTNTCGSPVAANGSCTISVTFTPTAFGSRSASVTITDNAANSPHTVSLTGIGSAPIAGVTATSLTFSSQNVGTASAAQTVTLNNTGNASLSITSIALSGTNSGDYAQTNTCGSAVAASSSCTINVTLTPAAPATRTATLTITDNDNNAAGSTQNVSLTGTGTGAAVSLSATSLTFGSQSVGVASPSQSVTLTNTGNASLTITSIPQPTGANGGDFSETTTCPLSPSTLAANASCTLTVVFTPSASGSRSGSLTITDNNGNVAGSTQSVTLTGTGLSSQISLSPSSQTFSSQSVGTTSSALTITLSTAGSVTINSISITGTNAGDFGQTNTCGSSVAAGGSCTISVTFSPTAPLMRTASVSIADNATGSPQTVSLTGTGSAPTAGVTATSLTFSSQNVGTASAAQTVTLNNTGNASLSITSVALSGTNSGDYAQTSSCGSSLAASSSCTINVTFTPTAPGTRTAALTITDNNNNAAGSTQSVSLTGTASAPTAGVTPTSLTFSSQNRNTTSTAQTVTLNNTGNAALSISSIGFTGANPGDFGQTNTCGSSLAAGNSCTIAVTFMPTAIGSRAASLNVTDNNNNVAGSQQSVSLTGTGSSPIVSLSASTLPFGSQAQSTTSTAESITLTNTGNAGLTITSISVTGANAGDFAQTNTCGSSVAASGTCTISVTLTPSLAAAESAVVAISDNAPGSPQSVTLTGTGTASVANLSSTSLSFGNQAVSAASTPAQVVTLTNTGNMSLGITTITVTGSNAGDFGETTTCGTSVAVSGSCATTITFTPSASGSRTAAISIVDTATAGSPQAVSLGGTGISGQVALSATTLAFGSQQVTTTSTPAQVVILTNGGSSSLTLTSITVAGANPGDFAQTNTCVSPVGVNGTCTVSVTFTPTTAGSRAATLTFTDNATNSPQTVSLTGTGTAPVGSLSPTTFVFPSQPAATPSSAQGFTLSNTGTAILNISSIGFTGTNPGDFSQNTTCGTTLAASTTCTITVVFTPAASGSRSGSLTVTDNSNNVAGSTQSATLSGTSVHDVILTWTASPTAGILGYNIYRGTTAGGESTTPLNSTPVNATTYVDTTVTAGIKYFYVVTAVAGDGTTQSSPSNEASATVPTP